MPEMSFDFYCHSMVCVCDLLSSAWLVSFKQVDHQIIFCMVYDIILLNMIISLILLNDNAKRKKKLANRSFVYSNIQFSVLLLLNLEYAVTTVEMLEYKNIHSNRSMDWCSCVCVWMFVPMYWCECFVNEWSTSLRNCLTVRI